MGKYNLTERKEKNAAYRSLVRAELVDELYEKILKAVDKGGAVIITMVEDRYPRRFYPEVFVSNNNRLKSVELN